MARETVSFSSVLFAFTRLMCLALENYVTGEKEREKQFIGSVEKEMKKEISSFGVKQSSEEKEMFEKICVKVFFRFFALAAADDLSCTHSQNLALLAEEKESSQLNRFSIFLGVASWPIKKLKVACHRFLLLRGFDFVRASRREAGIYCCVSLLSFNHICIGKVLFL
jgi:hypothetical protein